MQVVTPHSLAEESSTKYFKMEVNFDQRCDLDDSILRLYKTLSVAEIPNIINDGISQSFPYYETDFNTTHY